MPAMLSSMSRVLYDHGCKTLRIVLKSVRFSLLYPKLNDSEGKSRRKGRGKGKSRGKVKQKTTLPKMKGNRSLLVLMVIFCVGSGEAAWFSHNNNSETTEGVNEVLDNGVVEGVSIEVSCQLCASLFIPLLSSSSSILLPFVSYLSTE